MRTMFQRTKRHLNAVLRRLAIVLALATALLLGALSTAALATPRTAPARPATHTAVTPPADQPAPRPAGAILPLVLGAIVILAAYNNPPRYRGSH